ncbi:MAG: LOG family protein [Gemmataceae bacterium]
MTERAKADGEKFEQVHDEAPVGARPAVSAELLASQIRETADKLLRDDASRADMKLVSTALKELRYCFNIFKSLRQRRKVTVFGSARLPATDPAYAAAVEYGRRMAEANFMVITGAAAGIMEAGHVGSGRDNAIGINILLPFEQHANPIIEGDRKLMHLKYFFTRKLLFVKESDAVALFPGGFGTQDEGFEVLTLVQTGKSHLFPIVMVDAPGGDYWTRWQAYITDVLLARRLIAPEDLALYKICVSVDEAVDECLRFYHRYHSMRYVGDELVLRLQKPLSEALLERVRTEFAGIVPTGTFTQSGVLPAEGDEHRDLTRLRFRFNRRSMGRLRQLIDLINREG